MPLERIYATRFITSTDHMDVISRNAYKQNQIFSFKSQLIQCENQTLFFQVYTILN